MTYFGVETFDQDLFILIDTIITKNIPQSYQEKRKNLFFYLSKIDDNTLCLMFETYGYSNTIASKFLESHQAFLNRLSNQENEQLIKTHLLKEQTNVQYQQLHSVFNSLDSIISFKDYSNNKGKYLACNHAFCHLLGRSEEEIIGYSDIDFYGEHIGREIQNNDYSIFINDEDQHMQRWINYPDGSKKYVTEIKTPLYDRDSQPLGILTNQHDISAILHTNNITQSNSDFLTLIKTYNENILALAVIQKE